ncbi:MAG: hypothetical protein ABJQ70_14145 [Roseobacter sp.]
MDVTANGASKSRLAFAHERKGVHALNQAIRSALRSDPDTHPEVMFNTETGNRAFAADDRIVFTQNDKEIGVKNGMLGTVVTAQGCEIAVALDGGTDRLVRFDPGTFKTFDHGYAVTIHKSQGATVDQSYALTSRSIDRHLAHVAMTRHRDDMRLFINNRDRPSCSMDQKHRHHQKSTGTTRKCKHDHGTLPQWVGHLLEATADLRATRREGRLRAQTRISGTQRKSCVDVYGPHLIATVLVGLFQDHDC